MNEQKEKKKEIENKSSMAIDISHRKYISKGELMFIQELSFAYTHVTRSDVKAQPHSAHATTHFTQIFHINGWLMYNCTV